MTIAREKIYTGDPWKELDQRVWVMLSSGPMSLMNMDRRLYKGVVRRIYRHSRPDAQGKRFYAFWVKRASFRAKGHRFL